eukprot:5341262-Prymnesium_polylepis.1
MQKKSGPDAFHTIPHSRAPVPSYHVEDAARVLLAALDFWCAREVPSSSVAVRFELRVRHEPRGPCTHNPVGEARLRSRSLGGPATL